MTPPLPSLFRAEEWKELGPYLRVHPPQALVGKILGAADRPPAETASFDRSREVPVEWSKLVRHRGGSSSLYLSAFRDWIEASWPPADWTGELAKVVVRATAAHPFHHIVTSDLRRPWIQEHTTYQNGELALLDRGRGDHLLVDIADVAVRDRLAAELLAGGQSYERAWASIVRLLPVTEKLPAAPPFDWPQLVDRPPFQKPGGGFTDPPRDIDFDLGRPIFGRSGLAVERDALTDKDLEKAKDGAHGLTLKPPVSSLAGDAVLVDVNPPIEETAALAAARKRLESSWGFDPTSGNDPLDHLRTVDTTDATAKRFWRLASVSTKRATEKRKILIALDKEPWFEEREVTVPLQSLDHSWIAVPQGTVLLRHESLGLWYRLVPSAGTSLDVSDATEYDLAWQGTIVDVELIAEVDPSRRRPDLTAPPPEDVPLPEIEELDLAAQVIRDEYRRIDIRRTGLSKIEPEKLLLEANAGGSLDPTAVDSALVRYEALRLRMADLNRGLARLQEQARSLGYALAIGGGTYAPFRDLRLEGSSPAHADLRKLVYPVQAGELFRVEWRQQTWVETIVERHRRSWSRLFGLLSGSVEIEIRRDQTRTHRFLGWEPVLVTENPVEMRTRELAASDEAFHCFVFGSTDAGATTADGLTLSEVMSRCSIDERFRRRCALFFPRYEESLTRGKIPVAYTIVKRPLPGFEPLGVPRLYLEEKLSYRTRWLGVELGELVYALNLAPGESRKVSVTRKFNLRTETRRSVTSLLDITSSSSEDLATEMENERRRERTDTQSSNWSVSASASYAGLVSAGGSGGGNRTTTTNDFARDLHKLARKASRSLTQRQREEITTTTSTEQTTAIEDSSVGEFTNVNQGATLNLLFYRLLNVVQAGLHLNELRLLVSGGREVVAGTGIVEQRIFSLREFPEALRTLLVDSHFLGLLGVEPADLLEQVVANLRRLLLLEYLVPEAAARLGDAASAAVATRRSCGAFALLDATTPNPTTVPALSEDRLEQAGRELAEFVSRLVSSPQPIAGHQHLELPSGALWIESAVGLQPGTDPYAERIREAEYRGRLADIEAKLARAAVDRSIAGDLAPGTNLDLFEQLPITHSGSRLDISARKFVLKLDTPLPNGVWVLFGDGAPLATVPANQLEQPTLTWDWENETPGWALAAAGAKRLILADLGRRVRIALRA